MYMRRNSHISSQAKGNEQREPIKTESEINKIKKRITKLKNVAIKRKSSESFTLHTDQYLVRGHINFII